MKLLNEIADINESIEEPIKSKEILPIVILAGGLFDVALTGGLKSGALASGCDGLTSGDLTGGCYGLTSGGLTGGCYGLTSCGFASVGLTGGGFASGCLTALNLSSGVFVLFKNVDLSKSKGSLSSGVMANCSKSVTSS
ncbi:unnamed protein product [Brachionus calyciflorus]|uniref:Uncharacterized protein n=1 Tax=Brachionus calyciflorus TaxID=104777 RepID=A0A814II97_9BILA|nr:unnamed protein product [Brachionus calyciflorus]